MTLQERLRHASQFETKSLRDLLNEAAGAIDAKQAHIDRLMLEYEPDEMTAEQKAEWARSQRGWVHVNHCACNEAPNCTHP